jgi:hypothetical protein
MTILIATTVAPYKASIGEASWWLMNSTKQVENLKAAGHDTKFLCVAEVDSRGKEPYRGDLIERFAYVGEIPGVSTVWWEFRMSTGDVLVDGNNRLKRICTGRNLIQEYATEHADISHILFVDSDLVIPEDAAVRLLEVEWPIVGGDVPAYCLNGPEVEGYEFPVQEHMNTAGFLMVSRQVFTRLRWRWNPDVGMTDDPCYHADAIDAGFGVTRVRKDVVGLHQATLVPMEQRGYDRRLSGF